MKEPIEQREALWEEFIETWPLERLATLSLQAYNQAGSDESFCRWLEKRTESLGSIWGGSSLKFGIYSRANADKDPSGQAGVMANARYAWYSKLGQSETEAFERVRSMIVTVAQAANEGKLDVIEAVDLWPIFKWKIAFLYQNRQSPKLLPIYLRKYLRAAVGEPAPKLHHELYVSLLAHRGEIPLLAYADMVYDKAQAELEHQKSNAVLQHFSAIKNLHERLEASQAAQAFCDLALALHEQGLDWWITEAGAIHAGRTEDFRVWQVALALRVDVRAEATCVALNGAGEDQWQVLDETMVDALVETIAERDDLRGNAKRDGYWPDDYDNMADRLVITLKDGAIRNGYLTIPKLQRLFPDECLAQDDHPAQKLFTLRLPDGTSQQTQVLTQYNRIQARFSALFAREKLQPGDQAVLTQLAEYDYQLSFGRSGEQVEHLPAKATNMGQEALMRKVPLNQILFGPPGTGKTYETIDSALEILDPESLELPREERKARFDELVEAQRISFVTFHQSFSYEDFVEGLRAEPAPANAEGVSAGVQYRVEEGVFLRICREALRDRDFEQRVGVRSDAKVWKISIEEASSLGLTRKYCFEHGEARIGWPDVGDIQQANLTDPDLKLGTNEQSSLTCFGLSVEPGDVLVCLSSKHTISAVGVVTGEYEYSAQVPVGVREDYVHRLPVNWLAKGLSFDITSLNHGVKPTQKTMYELWRITWPALQAALQREGILLGGEPMPERQENLPHVLIIDEINRGNVSRIFGELITLIEPSKRAGAEEALSVVLPYSKQRFSVPANVHLIGTMNTADRSLAGLDMALRRRFEFREMPPRPELLDGVRVEKTVDVGQLLRVMNQRIEVLLDRDHCLGHAYFMPLKADGSLARLELIFRNQILPLLQEYFFEDWQRIQWVLNDHRKPATDRFVEQDKQDVAALFGSISVPAQGGVWRINDAAFKRLSAYVGVIAVNTKAEEPAEELEEASA